MHKEEACGQYFRLLHRPIDLVKGFQLLNGNFKRIAPFMSSIFLRITTSELCWPKTVSSVTVLHSSLSYFLPYSFQVKKRVTLMNLFDVRSAKELLSLHFFAGSNLKARDLLYSRRKEEQTDGMSSGLLTRRTERPL